MKRLSQLVASLTIVAVGVLSALTATAASVEPLPAQFPNADFEKTSADGSIPDWSERYTGAGGGFALVGDTALGGSQAVRMTDTSAAEQIGLLSGAVAVRGGTDYQIAAWGKVAQGMPSMIVWFFDDTGARVGTADTRVRQPSGTWERYSFEATAPVDAVSAQMLLYSATAEITDVLWDQVGISETTDASVIPNAGFEDLVVDALPARWSQRYVGAASTIEVVNDPVRSGARSLLIDDPSASEQVGLLSESFPIVGGGSYEAGGWVRVEKGVPSWILYYYDALGARIGQSSHRVPVAAGEWLWESESVEVPADAVSARFLVYSSTQDVTRAHWDDLSVEPVTPWAEEFLGHPVEASNIIDTSYGIGSDGRAKVYAVTAGVPATFMVFDVLTARLEQSAALPAGSTGSWAVKTASDGTVYIGTYTNGKLFRWLPGESRLVDLGAVTSTAKYLWDLEEDGEGRIWGGSFPGGELFSFDPREGVVTGHGRLSADEYTRSIAVHDGIVYAGTGSTSPTIITHEIATGQRGEVALPESMRDNEFVYFMDVRDDLLFARITPIGHTLVYDLLTGEWVDSLGATGFGSVSEADGAGNVYYVDSAGTLATYNLTSRVKAKTGVTGLHPARDFGIVELNDPRFPGESVAFMYESGDLNIYNIQTGTLVRELTDAITSPIKIQGIAVGPDERVYIGGYMYEGVTAFDPQTQEFEAYPRGVFGQIEGMLAHEDDLYVGTYTRANLFRFDPAQPWNVGTSPKRFASLGEQHQDRPYAWASAGDVLVAGTVPTYGVLGGLLVTYDPVTGAVETHADVIPDHSIVALSSFDDIVYGGTSVYGGLGAAPTAQEGVVFAWDPATEQLLWQTQVGAGIAAVTAVQAGPDGRLWAVDSGRLYELDRGTGAVLRSVRLMADTWNGSSIWKSGDIKFGPDGAMYVLSRGSIFHVEQQDLRPRKLASGIANYVFAVQGNDIYFTKADAGLYRVRGPEVRVEMSLAGATERQAVTGEAVALRLGEVTGTGLSAEGLSVSIDWSDGHDADAQVDVLSPFKGVVRTMRTFAAAGEYSALVRVSDGETTREASVRVVVADRVYAPALEADEAVTAGSSLTLSGTGFAAGEHVDVVLAPRAEARSAGLASNGIRLTVDSDATGGISGVLAVPVSSAAGDYTLTAIGEVSAVPVSVDMRVLAAEGGGTTGPGESPNGTDGAPVGEPRSDDGNASGGLAMTGAASGALVLLALLLLAAGSALVVRRRRLRA
ncbi:PQQ-binding-like beta-propeller repeat protein [Microbacterium esteraromaticum]|uniref:PQQ-binding-like beta-propeller repeat protein n=1 Tax=Microbacterium esteraromaticum TaxID=57043 RepID=UPI001A8DD6E6|nr:PQQ-binding-like beta-propeller repeat protein [Microbacterium esteraromaticum]MBN8424763.1 PQQ-binding-like beta-propeller repeat protein [Microbacterium esteraromaticum]